jgi:hypothetical protein
VRRLTAYLIKTCEFRSLVDQLRDRRKRPRIPTANVWLSAFLMFVLRLKSFNRLEQELRVAKRLDSFVGKRKPSADTIGRVFSGFDCGGLRRMMTQINRGAWRRKAIHQRNEESYRVAAVDGHELWASRSRCCQQCSVRKVTVGKGEKKRKVKEYYHRVVVAQWVGVNPPAILDIELIKEGEGEVVAARRLLKRVFINYSRLVDVITADALYLEAPFISTVLDAGKHFVIVMKQEKRDLYQDADRLRSLLRPRIIADGSKTTHIWDIPELTSFGTLGKIVRVVWAEEETLKRKIIGGKPTDVQERETWIWVTDLPANVVSASRVQQWGHDRWNVENRGFNELVNLWNMDHCFIHNTTAIEALLLTLSLAFLLTYLFYERNLKPAARLFMTRLAMASRLLQDFVLLAGSNIWPSLQRSG